jgi:hypothetical protein
MAQVSVITTVGKTILSARIQHTTPGGATSTPPTLGSEAPGRGLAMGTGATAAAADAAVGDTALIQEVETRATGTETVTTNVYQSVGTQTATGARTIDELGMLDSQAQTTTSSGASAGATTLPLASGVFSAAGTAHAFNATTNNSQQSITISSGGNTTSATVTALTGIVSAGAWVTAGNLFARCTLRSVTISLANGDSIQATWQVTFS